MLRYFQCFDVEVKVVIYVGQWKAEVKVGRFRTSMAIPVLGCLDFSSPNKFSPLN